MQQTNQEKKVVAVAAMSYISQRGHYKIPLTNLCYFISRCEVLQNCRRFL